MLLHLLILSVHPLSVLFSVSSPFFSKWKTKRCFFFEMVGCFYMQVTPLSWAEWKAVLYLSFPVSFDLPQLAIHSFQPFLLSFDCIKNESDKLLPVNLISFWLSSFLCFLCLHCIRFIFYVKFRTEFINHEFFNKEASNKSIQSLGCLLPQNFNSYDTFVLFVAGNYYWRDPEVLLEKFMR